MSNVGLQGSITKQDLFDAVSNSKIPNLQADLRSNNLTGNMSFQPGDFKNASNLTCLIIDHNNFEGKINLGSLIESHLKFLSLLENPKLSGINLKDAFDIDYSNRTGMTLMGNLELFISEYQIESREMVESITNNESLWQKHWQSLKHSANIYGSKDGKPAWRMLFEQQSFEQFKEQLVKINRN